ncbi:PREDICTED: formin-like protein 20 isoform X2 [Thamnophis sirtalis]|uniref:Formin-like protein 20 isoform X2 n=1 Tax=Thamnophis sirtalis TaxID=35019 RepID=A0A6I9YW66_9SAUR|nr:PREDICTED: formin-like protein 20 isoform X2 [Thamnophis sirtalis]
MEVEGDGVGPFHLGPLTSTPKESSTSSLPTRTDSLSSENSDSSGEDWLIKIRCPGARHRYSKRAHAKKGISSRSTKTETSSILDKKDDFTDTEKTELTPTTSYQDYTKVPRQESTDLEWLIRLRCPRAQMEELMPDVKQPFPGVTTFLSKSQSKILERSPSEKTKTSESWLTQKHLSIAQASSAPGSSISLCVLLPPSHPLFESQSPPYSSYFPSFLPPFPFSLLSISPSVSPPMIILPSVLLPPSVPSHFFHLLPPFPPYLHSPSIFFPSPFLQLSPTELVSSPNALSSLPKTVGPPTSTPALQSSASSAMDIPSASQKPPDSKPKYSCDFSAYHSHNPFFLPVLPPIQSQRRYQARQKNSDSVKYP